MTGHKLNHARLFLTTIPKSGTHLLIEFLKQAGMSRQPFGEHKLVADVELLFFHQHHKVEYETALHTQFNEMSLALATDSYSRSLSSAADNFRQMSDLSYCFYHVPHEPKLVDLLRKESIPMVFLVRDPRDVAISLTHHIMRARDGKKHQTLATLATDEDRYLAVIRGCFGMETSHFPLLPISYLFERFERWLLEPDVLILRYEDIIGPRGGGGQNKQYESYARFARHIGLDLSEDMIQFIADNIYNESAPFFIKGQIGQWRDKFTPRIENEFHQQMGKTLHLWLD